MPSHWRYSHTYTQNITFHFIILLRCVQHLYILCSQTITPTADKAYLFYNFYIFDPFAQPLQLPLPQHVQIVQIRTHETWTRLEEGNLKLYSFRIILKNIFGVLPTLIKDILLHFTCLTISWINTTPDAALFKRCHEFNLLLALCFTDRLSSHKGWTALPNPSFPCRRSANSQQKSVSPDLWDHYCCRSVKSGPVTGWGFFGGTWLDSKVVYSSFFVRLKCGEKTFGLLTNRRL